MKALTVYQPWASLISIGAKPYEFRGYALPRFMAGERVAIHAGARPVKLNEVDDLISRIEANDKSVCLITKIAAPFLIQVRAGLLAIKRHADFFRGEDEPEPFRLPLGAVVCTATLWPSIPGDEAARRLGYAVNSDNPNRPGVFNYAWPVEDIQPLLPARPARGAQGFWEWLAEEKGFI